jgi:hypothetical protein
MVVDEVWLKIEAVNLLLASPVLYADLLQKSKSLIRRLLPGTVNI